MRKKIILLVLITSSMLGGATLFSSHQIKAQKAKVDITIGNKVGETLHCRCKDGYCIQGKWISFKPLCGRYAGGLGDCGVLSMNCQR